MTRVALLCVVLVASACTQLPLRQTPAPDAETVRCERLLDEVDRAVAKAGVADGGAARIPGFPYLRADRFLASLAGEVSQPARFDAWVSRLRALDRAGRDVEIANLPVPQRLELEERYGEPLLFEGTQRCAAVLQSRDLAGSQQRDRLRDSVTVPDDYDTWKRVIGLYWLTRIPFAAGVRNYQREALAAAERPLVELRQRGALVSYGPPAGQLLQPQEVRAILERARDNALGIPEPHGADAQRLFEAFAPVWVVDTHDDNDRIGVLRGGEGTRAQVDIDSPVVYRRVAHTRYRDAILLQLVYSVWFPARPLTSTTDLLGGHLDGVIWRVTLAPDGTPILYDSIHNCGCYHQFFPTPRARLRPPRDTLDEQAFVLQQLGSVELPQRVVVRLASGTHYIQRIVLADQVPADAVRYDFLDDSLLRSLRLPGGGRLSAFRPDGIVPGSERRERYLFWPMGVREPGAMREWGRHATAFVGRRHFDEARLMERYFELDFDPDP